MTTEKKNNMEDLIAQAIWKAGQEKDKQDFAHLKRFMEEVRPTASVANRQMEYRKKNVCEKEEKRHPKIKKLIFTITSMAAVFALIFSLNIWHENQLMDKVFITYYSPLKYDSLFRGNDEVSFEILEAMIAYNKRKYDSALCLFNDAFPTIADEGLDSISLEPVAIIAEIRRPNDYNVDEEYLIYKAICLIETEQYKQAEILLKELIGKGESTEYWQQANWYLANVYLKQHEKKDATQLLEKIVASEGYYCDKAKDMLNSLK